MRRRIVGAITGALLVAGVLAGPSAHALKSPHVAVVQTLQLPSGNGVAATSSSSATTSATEPAFCSRVSRATSDRADLHDGALVHVIYLLPSGTKDEEMDADGTLACTVAAQNDWMRSQSGLEWRLDTAILDTADPADPNSRVETLDVTFIRSTMPPESLDTAAEVSTELALRGFDLPGKRYLTYVASGLGSGVCGDAFYPLDHNLGAVDGQYAQVYLDSSAGCGARLFGTPASGGGISDAIAQQELIHNDGMTPFGAPHTCTNVVPIGHLCTGPLYVVPSVDPEGMDVMFPFVNGALRDKVLDRGHDDYFEHPLPIARLEDSAYLQAAGAWGKPFVQRRDGSQPEPSPSATSTPAPTTAPKERSIEASVDKRRVPAGSRVKITGAITGSDGCTADQEVALRRRDLAKGRDLSSIEAASAADGTFAFRAKVRRPTRFVVTAPGTDSCAGASSKPLVVKVG